MSFYLRILGGILILLFALVLGRAYSSYARRALEELEGFIALISHIRQQISVRLATQSTLTRGFECESLERCGFLPAVRRGEKMLDAYNGARLSVCADARRVLLPFFTELGSGYVGDELKRADCTVSACESILRAEREETPRDVKLVFTLLSALALGILIFLI